MASEDRGSDDKKGVSMTALVSLMTGLAGMVFSFACPYHTGKAFVLSVVGIVCGIMSLSQAEKGGKMAVAGVVLGTIGICFWYLCRSTDVMALIR